MGNQQGPKGPSLVGKSAPNAGPQPVFVDPDGNAQPGNVDSSGNIKVAVTGAGSGGTSSVDESTFVAGTTAGTPAMGVYEATPSALTDGQLGVIAVDADRNVKVNIVAGSSGNGAAGPTGDPVPAQADYLGIQNPAGDLEGIAAEQFDYDTSGSSQPQFALGVLIPASGGPTPVLGGHGTAAAAMRVELPTDGTGVIATVGAVTAITNPLPAGTNVIGHVIADSGSTTAVTGNVTVVQPTAASLNATVTVAAGSAVIGHVITDTGSTTAVTGNVTVVQGTASNLKAQVTGAGTAGSADAGVQTIQGIASMTPVLVSGTGTAGTAATAVVTVQGIASMTKLLVTPDANSAVNVAQLAGTATDTNSGSKSAGTLRVVLATDQPQLTNKLLVTPDANSAVNLSQVNAATVNVGAGNAGTGTQRVSISTDDVNLAAINAVSGTTAGAAVITDANGTLQQYLRGIIKLAITTGGWLVNQTQIAGTAVAVNSGVNSAGVQRVTVATDDASLAIPATIFNGVKTVTTAGTRVTLAASQAVKSVTIKALVGNTGVIYVGNATVAAANGLALAAGDSISLNIANLNTVNLDASVNGEGVSYLGVL